MKAVVVCITRRSQVQILPPLPIFCLESGKGPDGAFFFQLGVTDGMCYGYFPIPGKVWKGYTDAQRTEAMSKFDHYHQPSDEWRADFPWVGTAHFADWVWEIVRNASNRSSL